MNADPGIALEDEDTAVRFPPSFHTLGVAGSQVQQGEAGMRQVASFLSQLVSRTRVQEKEARCQSILRLDASPRSRSYSWLAPVDSKRQPDVNLWSQVEILVNVLADRRVKAEGKVVELEDKVAELEREVEKYRHMCQAHEGLAE